MVGSAGVDAREFTGLMGAVCSHVTIVAAMDGDRPHGTTVTAFCSLSLRPPMVVVALDGRSRLLEVLAATDRLAVNLLNAGQSDLAVRFATKSDEKFTDVRWDRSPDGLPVIENNAGWLSCRVTKRVIGGDHIVLLCNVVATRAAPSSPAPLIYWSGQFGTHSGSSDDAGITQVRG